MDVEVAGGGWRKSSYSKSGACVEIGSWRTSSRCESGACVEVGRGGAVIGVRDSKLTESPVLKFTAAAWARFTAGIKGDDGRRV